MTATPVPHTWTAGDDATATVLQTLTDASLFLLGSATSGGAKKSNAELQQGLAQPALATGVWTDIPFDAETVDYDNGHSTVTLTAQFKPTTPGYLQFSGGVAFAANATGRRGTRWALNGTAINATEQTIAATAANPCIVAARTIKVFLNGSTDYVTLQGMQDSGAGVATFVSGSGASGMSVAWVSN